MGSLAEGVEQVVTTCLRIEKGEKVVIITDRETLRIAQALRDRIEKAGCDPRFYILEDFHERPLPELPAELEQAVLDTDVSIYAGQSAPGELGTFRLPLLRAIQSNKAIRHAHMIQITKQIMEEGMCVDYNLVKEVTTKVREAVTGASEIRVTTPLGTDVTARFDPEARWVQCDGNIVPGTWTNLPDGETFTCPERVDGIAVVDGVLGDVMQKYGSLKDNPVTLVIEGSRVKDIRCDNKDLLETHRKIVFESCENSNRIGEFAFGTNLGLTHLIGHMLQDEKFPSVHMATGDPLGATTRQNWSAKTHVDGVITNTTATVDGRTIMKDGKYTIL
jgi:leucyl aminopeptidase (aminopeptidase T)